MARREIRCRGCGQLNVRRTGLGAVLNPRSSGICTACGSNLRTGERLAADALRTRFTFLSIYVLHAMVGLLAAFFVVGFTWPGAIGETPGHFALCAGAAAGLGVAEWSRRRRELLGRHRD